MSENSQAADAAENQETAVELPVATKPDFLDAPDLTIEPMDIPEWNCRVHLRSLKGNEIGVFSKLVNTTGGELQDFPIESVATVCAMTLCDEKGHRMFDDHQAGSTALLEKNWSVLQRIFKRALKISAMTTEEGEETPGKD